MTEKCEICGYPLVNYQDQVEHSGFAHPNLDPERPEPVCANLL